MKPYPRLGMVARWQPVHLGHATVLHALCYHADHALIGIGSSNRYNWRNPFTLDETSAMLHEVLAGQDNYTLLPVPDLDNGPRWRSMVIELFGLLDAFVTDNGYVASLLRDDYTLLKPVSLVSPDARIAVNGTMVRQTMAHGDGWQALVPASVARYITTNQLDSRFRREFGACTLAIDSMTT